MNEVQIWSMAFYIIKSANFKLDWVSSTQNLHIIFCVLVSGKCNFLFDCQRSFLFDKKFCKEKHIYGDKFEQKTLS